MITEANHGAATAKFYSTCRTTTSCGNDTAIDIRFPFTIKDKRSSGYEGYPGFELFCSTETNQTLLHLPNSVNFIVQRIDYESQRIYLRSPDGCLPRQLRDLELSASPFKMGEVISIHTFFNCSKLPHDMPSSLSPEPCLGHGVYSYYSKLSLDDVELVSCKKMYNLPVTGLDDPYLSWSEPGCRKCYKVKRECCVLKQGKLKPEVECSGDANRSKVLALKKGRIAGVTLGSVSIAVLVIALHRAYNYSRREKEYRSKVEEFLDDYKAVKPTRFSYADIKRITNQFTVELGRGTYGTVFKGKLSNEIEVAVKVLGINSSISKGNGEDFVNEVGAMAGIHHVNVVRLVGFCADGFRRALVYEYLPNDSLQKYISYKGNQHSSFGLKKLQEIAIGVAKGIEYLHHGCHQRILHFDIKPCNILLDQDFTPKISDFGLAKLCAKDQSAISMTTARGTIGYIAPEVFSRNFGNVSHKADVYSFGMLLLEIVGGRNNVDVTTTDGTANQIYFPEWIYSLFRRSKEELRFDIEEDEEDGKIRKKMAIAGLWCIQWNPVDRPPMKLVVQMLEGEVDLLKPPPNPVSSNPDGGGVSVTRTAAMMKSKPLQDLEIIPEIDFRLRLCSAGDGESIAVESISIPLHFPPHKTKKRWRDFFHLDSSHPAVFRSKVAARRRRELKRLASVGWLNTDAMSLAFISSIQNLWPLSVLKFNDLRASDALVKELCIPEGTKRFVYAVRDPKSDSVIYILSVQNLSERSAADVECLIREVRPEAVISQVGDPTVLETLLEENQLAANNGDLVPTSSFGVLKQCFIQKINKEKYESIAGNLVLREIFGVGFHAHIWTANKTAKEIGSSFFVLEAPCTRNLTMADPTHEADKPGTVERLVSSLIPHQAASIVSSSPKRLPLSDVQSKMVMLLRSNMDAALPKTGSSVSVSKGIEPETTFLVPAFAQSIYPLLLDLHNIFMDLPSVGKALNCSQKMLYDINRGESMDTQIVSEVCTFRIAVEGLRIALNNAGRLPMGKLRQPEKSNSNFSDLPVEEKSQALLAHALQSQSEKFKTIVAVIDASSLAGLRKHWNTPLPLEIKGLIGQLITDCNSRGEASNQEDDNKRWWLFPNKPVVAVGAGATAVVGVSSLSKVVPASTFMKVVSFKFPASLKLVLTQTQKVMSFGLTKSGPTKAAVSAEKIRTVAHGIITSVEKTSVSAMRTAFYEIMRKRRVRPIGFLPWATFGGSIMTLSGLLMCGDGIECVAESFPSARSIASLGRGIRSLREASQQVRESDGVRIQRSIESLMYRLKKVTVQ
ncbi:unnamed protein product [Linum tenue]|uniref:Protein kinase domain-containing protein n=1 Tax=Linum tenue TaxID=586396 RepID=A0AAV0Q8C8_9ROSI|nr:unnamed protein product [Linum tenue]